MAGVTALKSTARSRVEKALGLAVSSGVAAVLAGHALAWGQAPESGVERVPAASMAPAATAAASAAALGSAGAAHEPRQIQIVVPRSVGRLRTADIGLVINTRDPYSVEVGSYYAGATRLETCPGPACGPAGTGRVAAG